MSIYAINYKSRFFLSIITIQLIGIFILSYFIYSHSKSVKGISTYVVNKKEISELSIDNLNYFYDFSPHQIYSEDMPWEPYSKVIHRLNSDGFNQEAEYQQEKADNDFRVVTLGDSFTFGVYVDTKKNYPSNLLNYLQRLSCNKNMQIFNIAVPGYDIEYSVERYNLHGRKLNPDLVLWLLKDDDVEQVLDIMTEMIKNSKDKLEKTGEYEKLKEKGDYYPEITVALSEFQKTYTKASLLAMQKDFLRGLPYKGNLIIITLPNSKDETKTFIKQFVSSRKNTYYLDELTDIYNSKDNYFPDKHPTEKGYQLIANDIGNFLQKKKLIPCH